MFSFATRYILRQILSTSLIATISMCLLVTLVQSIKFVDMIINNGLPITEFLSLSVLAAPRYLTYLLPIVLFGATLFTYNRMSSDSEIVVFRAAGMSRAQLAKGGILAGLISVFLCLSLTTYLMPLSMSEFRGIITQARSQLGSAILKEGQFTNITPTTTIYIREKLGETNLQGIIFYNSLDELTVIAERGNIVETSDGPRVVVYNGNQQVLRDGELHLLSFAKSTLDIGLTKEQNLLRWREPNERLLPDLFFPDPNNPNDRQYFSKLIAEGHARLVLPAFCLILPLIAIASLLSGSHSRRGESKKVMTAIILMLSFLIIHIWLTSAAGKSPTLLPIMYVNAAIPFVGSLYVIYIHNGPFGFKRKSKRELSDTASISEDVTNGATS
ncbi:MAG: LptF/LptG family permease [Alphaproteobacteria bacterium]|nr:LptF/LptG family permease [Alphaproteobacteria bacterium]